MALNGAKITLVIFVIGQAILFYNTHDIVEAGYGTIPLIVCLVDAFIAFLAATSAAVIGAAHLVRLFRHIAFK